ncbi:glycerophosphodiester phosphodiesterase family protein [Boudabousia marimammalium]|nr:glycerophosphodiester phosphodiesterase family protein [Boudabousia marimammalium]
MSGHYLENTSASFEAAVKLPADVIETDARTTKDGVAVLIHDPDLSTVSDVSTPVQALTWDEIKRIKLHDSSTLMRVDEALSAFPDTYFNIDMKDEGALDSVFSAVQDTNAQERVCISSFSDSRLQALRARTQGRIATSLSPLEVLRLMILSSVRYLPGSTQSRKAQLRKLILSGQSRFNDRVLAAQVPVRTIFDLVPVITPSFVATAHSAGFDVHVWTINELDMIPSLIGDKHRVDAIITDYPLEVSQVIKR